MPRVAKVRELRRRVWVTPQEAADHLGVHVKMIYDACLTKGLRSVKLGHSTRRLKLEWVDEWAEKAS